MFLTRRIRARHYAGVRAGSEASTKPGDQFSLTLRLPKDTAPDEIAGAVVRKDHICGQPSQGLLGRYVNS